MRVIVEVHISRLCIFTALGFDLLKPRAELLVELPILLLELFGSPVLLIGVLFKVECKEQGLNVESAEIFHSIVHRLGGKVLVNITRDGAIAGLLLPLVLLLLFPLRLLLLLLLLIL